MGLSLRVIGYGTYYTISYRQHNRRMNLATGDCGVSLHSGLVWGESVTTVRENHVHIIILAENTRRSSLCLRSVFKVRDYNVYLR